MINRVLLLALLCTGINATAQLNVRNNAYIFVTDEVLFVNDNINLQETDSKIYLRNEAQLIQGTGTTFNSGIGELSVYQTGTANNFAYNYWCSPVGDYTLASGNENEDAKVELIDEATNIVTAADPTGLISSANATFIPGYDGTASPLEISNRWLYSFVVSDEYAEWIPLDGDSPLNPGLGFTMKGIGAGGQLYDFRGRPNNGTISNLIAADQFTLIGNPYPSALDALLFIHDPQNSNINSDVALAPAITGALYYWEQQPTDHFTSNYIGGYATYTISSGGIESFAPAVFFAYDALGNAIPLPPPPATGSKIARRYIPVGQGFMVEGSPSIPATPATMVYVKNAHRVFEKESDGNSYFFRTDSNNEVEDSNVETTQYNEFELNIVPDDFKRFRINVLFNNEFKRQLLQNFHSSATDGFDYGLEAPASDDSPTDASWFQDEEPFVIQAHQFAIDKRIPLVIKLEEQQPIDFSIFDVQNFDNSQPIYLHDIENELYVDLNEQNYSINLPAGNYPNRFEITFEQEDTLNTLVITDEDFDVFQNTQTAELTILNPNNLEIKTVTLYDVTGKQIINTENIGTQSAYRYSTKSLTDGIYIATITVNSNQAISKKVVIKN